MSPLQPGRPVDVGDRVNVGDRPDQRLSVCSLVPGLGAATMMNARGQMFLLPVEMVARLREVARW